MTEIVFQAWPKIPRLFRDMVITEKIDGTNAAIGVTADGQVYAQSRTRLITPGNDNYGFAAWVYSNQDVWPDLLGPGLHFGEWWGLGIQRGYGLQTRNFSLFNSKRWEHLNDRVGGVPVGPVPTLARYTFSQYVIDDTLAELRAKGSQAAPGYMNPEGIVVFHGAANQTFKVLLESDDLPKGQAA